MSIRVLIKDHPNRAIALATTSHVLILRHSSNSTADNGVRNDSQSSLGSDGATARCMVEFSRVEDVDTADYRSLSTLSVHGTLGLITVNGDVFLVVVSGASKVASVRPGETVLRIHSVSFCGLPC
jgi:hypothetical protein